MPAIAVVAGAIGVASGVSAIASAGGLAAMWEGAGALATISAGASIVGGAMTAIGGLTGNNSLMSTGGLINAAGLIGTTLSDPNSPIMKLGQNLGLVDKTAPISATDVAPTIDKTISTNTQQPIQQAAITAPAKPFSADLNAPPVQPASTVSAVPSIVNQEVNAAAAGQPSPSLATVNQTISNMPMPPAPAPISASDQALQSILKGQQQLQKYSMIASLMGGIGSAVTARTNADIQAQTQANYLAFQQQQWNTAQANANALPANIPVSAVPASGALAVPKAIPGVTTGVMPYPVA